MCCNQSEHVCILRACLDPAKQKTTGTTENRSIKESVEVVPFKQTLQTPNLITDLLVTRFLGRIKTNWSNLGQKFAQLAPLKEGER